MPDAPVEGPERSGPRWWAITAFVVALCLLAGVVGWQLADSGPDRPAASSVDVGFMNDMTLHHQQALTMAFDYLRNGQDPLLLQIAREIVLYQSQEIGVMNQLLTEWDRTGIDSKTAMAWMHTPVPAAAMPGLATDAQLAELSAARGAQLDDLFTKLMIDHHAGGIHMADYAALHGEEASTRYWASNMASGQRGEISELNTWRTKHGLAADVPAYIGNQPPSD